MPSDAKIYIEALSHYGAKSSPVGSVFADINAVKRRLSGIAQFNHIGGPRSGEGSVWVLSYRPPVKQVVSDALAELVREKNPTADDWNTGLHEGIKARRRGDPRDSYRGAWEHYRNQNTGYGYSTSDWDRARRNFIHAFILGYDKDQMDLPYPGSMPNPESSGHRIVIAYETVTPESAENGEAEEYGWVDEEGKNMDEEAEFYDGDVVKATIEELRDRGVSEPSSSSFHPGVWYTAYNYDQDYSTGATENRSYHLRGYTEDEERAVFNGLFGRRRNSGFGGGRFGNDESSLTGDVIEYEDPAVGGGIMHSTVVHHGPSTVRTKAGDTVRLRDISRMWKKDAYVRIFGKVPEGPIAKQRNPDWRAEDYIPSKYSLYRDWGSGRSFVGSVSSAAEALAEAEKIMRSGFQPVVKAISREGSMEITLNRLRDFAANETGRRGMRNPESSAAEMYESFHGKPSEEVLEIGETVHYHENLAGLGTLQEIKVDCFSGYSAELKFGPDTQLCSNEEGTQLYIVGGDQSLDLRELKFKDEEIEKDHVAVGVITEITYNTEKGFHNFKPTDYYHELGEETGYQPILTYDTRSQLLTIAGGAYRIKPEGIVN
jgi:hypothetical protein